MATATYTDLDTKEQIARIEQMLQNAAKANRETTQLADVQLLMLAEMKKYNAEALKIERERAWYPAVIIATAAGATSALFGAALALLKYLGQ